MTKKIVVCYKWKELVVSPREQHWGYSLHLKLEDFIEFAKANQAHKILRRAGSNIFIAPYGQPHVCWVNKAQYQRIKDNGLGTLHLGKSPEIYEIFNDLERINKLFTVFDRAGDLNRAEKEKEKHNAAKKSETKATENLIKIDDFKKRRQISN